VTDRRVVDDVMRRYYDNRAAAYGDWWLGPGMYANRDRPGWDREVTELIAVLAALPPAHVLDVACGTGFLTQHLRGEVVGLDQSPSMVDAAAARMPGSRVMQGDAVPLPFSDGEFDRVFTSHFYGHLLPGERARFVREARRVCTELVVTDAAKREGVASEEWQERVLNDGSRHQVYKRYFTGAELAGELGGGWVLHEGRWFVAVAGRGGPGGRARGPPAPGTADV
jgi:SAM-dependent methyltransferase